MKAKISEDKMSIELPCPLGSAVFIAKLNMYSGCWRPTPVEYTVELINADIFLTKVDADNYIDVMKMKRWL